MGDENAATPELAAAERRGFTSGLNVALLGMGILCAFGASIRSLYELPRFETVFKQVKVPVPALTLLIFDSYPVAVAGLLAWMIACVVATWRWGHRQRTVVMNAILLVGSICWVLVSVLATYLPFVHLLEGISQGRR